MWDTWNLERGQCLFLCEERINEGSDYLQGRNELKNNGDSKNTEGRSRWRDAVFPFISQTHPTNLILPQTIHSL